jgi:hypothetical protein
LSVCFSAGFQFQSVGVLRSFRRFILRYSVREISDSSTDQMKLALKPENIAQLVFFVRGEKVMFDADLAKLYGVSTKALNQALRRNRERFPKDFVFQLTAEEFAFLRSQSVTSSAEESEPQGLRPNWSQFVTSSRKHRGVRYRPYAFTEQDVAMLSSVLRPQARRRREYRNHAHVCAVTPAQGYQSRLGAQDLSP